MNDWTAEQAKGYEAMQEAQENFQQRMIAQFERIAPGSKVFFYNHATRTNVWANVAKVVATSSHVGYVVTDKGKQIWADEIKIVHADEAIETLQICLSDRVNEINEAARRATSNTMDVYADFERDNYVVVNRDNRTEYRVVLQHRGEKVFASCECADFKKRNRVCKHQVRVLEQWFAPLFDELRRGKCATGSFFASCEYGNFKRQHYSKSARFLTLGEAKAFILGEIGDLQGFGRVISGGEIVWEHSSEIELAY